MCRLYCFFFLMIRRPPRSTQSRSSAASDVYKRQANHCGPKSRCRQGGLGGAIVFGGGCCRRRWPPHRGTPYTRERARRWRTISESGAIPSHSREDCRSGALDREGDGLAMSDLTPAEPSIRRLAILGVGLIGGSLSLAAASAHSGLEVRGYDVDEASCAFAEDAGIVNQMCDSATEAV